MKHYLSNQIVPITLLLVTGLNAHAAIINYTLYVTAGSLTVNGAGGATLPAWSYTEIAGTPRFPGPIIMANENDTVNVTVVNNHTINHNFLVKGITTDTTAIAPGASKKYTLNVTVAGTYLYYDTLNNNINREMGLYGAFIVNPADGSKKAWTNGPAYSFQKTWVVGEMDKPRWNDVAGSGGTVSTSVYKPNYFVINGKGGNDAMGDSNTTISGNVGQTALVRIVNGGQLYNALHFHGNHFQVISINGVRQSSPYKLLDVINVSPAGTVDVLFYLNQPGHYPMHNHTAQMETANGVYLNGIAAMIEMN